VNNALKKNGWRETKISKDFISKFRSDLEKATKNAFDELAKHKRNAWNKSKTIILD
jgi:hypothetical protein